MDYTSTIEGKLHDHFSRLKKGEGLVRLNNALNQLNDVGLGQLVRAFISGMGDFGKAAGFLLEIETAQAAIAAYPNAKPSCERRERNAERPCDITIEAPQFRADFQCKAIQNFFNEKFIAEFLHWVRKAYSDVEPGRFMSLRTNTDADEATFQEFKTFFDTNWQSWALDEEHGWVDSRSKGKVWIALRPGCGPGIHQEFTQSPTQRLGFLQEEDTEHIQRRILDRIRNARTTFGFPPSATQFNFVVVGAPELAPTFDEDTLVDALYGGKCVVVDAAGSARSVRVRDGLFYREQIDYCSGVILCKFRIDGHHQCVTYPHPVHVQSVKDVWIGRGGFRLPDVG